MIKASDNEHADKVGICPVRVKIRFRLKGPYGECSSHPVVFIVKHTYISIKKEK